jgi:hypothetical protein
MRPVDEVEILEDLFLEDNITDIELGLPIDLTLTRDDLEEDNDDPLGFRTLYEKPETLIRRRSTRYRSRAA